MIFVIARKALNKLRQAILSIHKGGALAKRKQSLPMPLKTRKRREYLDAFRRVLRGEMKPSGLEKYRKAIPEAPQRQTRLSERKR